MRRRFHDEEEEELGEDELNLTPYLDLITTLVIFFVFTFQIIIEFRLIDVVPPELSTARTSGGSNTPQTSVTLFITENGYLLAASGATVASDVVAKKADGQYDPDALRTKMKDWKREFSLGTSLVLVAQEGTEYREVIRAMDAVRTDGKALLFPDVLFGQPVAEAPQ